MSISSMPTCRRRPASAGTRRSRTSSLDRARCVELAVAQLRPHPLARLRRRLARGELGAPAGACGRGGSSRSSSRSSALRSAFGRAPRRAAPRAPCSTRDLDQVAHHRLHVAADVADLGELRGLDLEERRLRAAAPAAARSRSCRRRSGRSSGCSSARPPRPSRAAAAGGACGCAARWPRRAWPRPGRRCTCRARRRSARGVSAVERGRGGALRRRHGHGGSYKLFDRRS